MHEHIVLGETITLSTSLLETANMRFTSVFNVFILDTWSTVVRSVLKGVKYYTLLSFYFTTVNDFAIIGNFAIVGEFAFVVASAIIKDKYIFQLETVERTGGAPMQNDHNVHLLAPISSKCERHARKVGAPSTRRRLQGRPGSSS